MCQRVICKCNVSLVTDGKTFFEIKVVTLMSSYESNPQQEAMEEVKNYFISFFLRTNEFYMHKKQKLNFFKHSTNN